MRTTGTGSMVCPLVPSQQPNNGKCSSMSLLYEPNNHTVVCICQPDQSRGHALPMCLCRLQEAGPYLHLRLAVLLRVLQASQGRFHYLQQGM